MRDTVLEQYLAKMGFLRDDYIGVVALDVVPTFIELDAAYRTFKKRETKYSQVRLALHCGLCLYHQAQAHHQRHHYRFSYPVHVITLIICYLRTLGLVCLKRLSKAQ